MDDSKIISQVVIILDINPSQPIIRKNPHHLTSILDAIVAFANAHLMQKAQNRIAVIASSYNGSQYLFPNSEKQLEIRQTDGQFEVFTLVEKSIKQKLAEIINNSPILEKPVESLLGGAIGMALCYINRMKKNTAIGIELSSRILVVSGSYECSLQYMTYMNAFFTCQKLNIILDCCGLDKTHTLLQQGCDLTGGQFIQIPHIEGLLQYLLWVFLPDQQTRTKLVLPPQKKIDYRAACFCHRELIDIGYVCSVCLSVFCKFTPICTTCQTVFKLPEKVKPKSKKKKLKHPVPGTSKG